MIPLLSTLTSKILAGVVVVLLVFSGVQTFRVGSLQDKLELAETKLVISNSSIDALKGAVKACKASVQEYEDLQDTLAAEGTKNLEKIKGTNDNLQEQKEKIAKAGTRHDRSPLSNPIECTSSQAVLDAKGL